MQKNANRFIFINLQKTQFQIVSRPQHETRYTKSNRREVRNSLEHIGTEDNFLNRTLATQALRLTINK